MLDVVQGRWAQCGSDSQSVIEQFWFDNTPSYVAKRRKKGIMTDRIEFGFGEARGMGLSYVSRATIGQLSVL